MGLIIYSSLYCMRLFVLSDDVLAFQEFLVPASGEEGRQGGEHERGLAQRGGQYCYPCPLTRSPPPYLAPGSESEGVGGGGAGRRASCWWGLLREVSKFSDHFKLCLFLS